MGGAKQKEMFEISDLKREILHLRSVCLSPPGSLCVCVCVGGGTLIFSCIRRLELFLGVQNFELQYFWGFQKTEYFWGYEDFVHILWGHHKIGLYDAF